MSIFYEPVAQASELVSKQVLPERPFIGRDYLVVVHLEELVKVEASIFKAYQVSEVGVDHLLQVLRVKGDLELKLLSEVVVEIDEFLTLHCVCLPVLESIEVLF